MRNNEKTTNFRPLSDLNLLDDFLFQEMLAQEEFYFTQEAAKEILVKS